MLDISLKGVLGSMISYGFGHFMEKVMKRENL